MPEITIDGTKIGDDNPCYTIAEAGANHDGNLNKAFKLIDAAVDGKAHSIKFQTYKAGKLSTKTAPKYWDDNKKHESQFDVFSKLDNLANDDWKQIFEYANEKQITCFSTPFDEKSVDLLYSLDVPAFKIASADLTHIPLIKHIASKQLPIFLSTGMASDLEIKEAINTIQDSGNQNIVLMHCMTSYPTKFEDANLDMIQKLTQEYPSLVIGYSDHTPGILAALFSTFYGSKVIEKHFTFDKTLDRSPDHWLSLDPADFIDLVNGLNIAKISKGSDIRNDFNCEKESIKYARRSIVSTQNIPKGTKISKYMLDVKRPATGIYPKFLDKVVNSTAKKDIEEDIPIQWDDIE
ncbi:N-acetylneuraminate synthase family protein [Nitrosopumilus piranensis]|uniref:N-acetylneuraminate synthase family protein n=1 Tax=Nitrosopumilus piranensis TaxID=1582439 RepID=UPI0013636587|nr:N-acetylneuraminate synthase family protein [Nitrosopumilus piranensis]